MKLLMENWRQFIKEQELQEATDEEISYLDDALNIPISQLPFGNIFGDKYRLIEELKVIDPSSPFKITMDALSEMGWHVSEPSEIKFDSKNRISGKIWCTKTKITKYIDKKGEVQTVKRAVKINLPKLLTGIVNFVENSEPALRTLWQNTIINIRKRKESETNYEDGIEMPSDPNPEAKYEFQDKRHDELGLLKRDEFLSIMKFVSSMHYWLGIEPDSRAFARGIDIFFGRKYIDFGKIKEFSLFLEEKFQNFLKNVNKLYQNYFLIYSRHPIDVFRMSDHKGLDSCHSLPSQKSGEWDKYNICALAEVYGNGMIVYAVPESEFEDMGIEPSEDALDKMDDEEIFADETRGTDGLEPSSRIRIRNASFHGLDEPIRLALPEKQLYGVELPGFRNKINSKMSIMQSNEIEKISQFAQSIDLSDFTRYGGDYEDNDAESLIPQLFSAAGKDNTFSGSVRYDYDLQNSMSQKVGNTTVEMATETLEEIFEGHRGGMISFSYNVEEDGYGDVNYDWQININFTIDFEIDSMGYQLYGKIVKSIANTIRYEIPDYYTLPEDVDYNIGWNDTQKQFNIAISYSGHELLDYTPIEELDSAIDNLLYHNPNFHRIFDYHVPDGPIQLIQNALERDGFTKSGKYMVGTLIDDYDLDSNNSWWELVGKEERYDDFNNEFIIGASFQEAFSFYPHELIEEIPDQLRPAAIKIMARFINPIVQNWKSSTEFIFDQDYNDKLAPITIMSTQFDGRTIGPEDILELVEGEFEMEFTIATSMTNTMSVEKLENIAKFLVNDASVDDITEKIEDKIKEVISSTLKQQMLESKRRIRVKIVR